LADHAVQFFKQRSAQRNAEARHWFLFHS
jgi:hypothetical protein